METTQSETASLPGKPGRVWQIVVGAALAPLAFLFGAFVALPALVFVLPKARRFWLIGAALFAGVLGVRALMLIGINPVLDYARSQAVTQLSEALGGDVSYQAFEGDAPGGRLHFQELTATVPAIDGELRIADLEINAGWFMMFRNSYEVTGHGLRVTLDPSGGKLEAFLKDAKAPSGVKASVQIAEGKIVLRGNETNASLDLKQLNAISDADGWNLRLGVEHASITVVGQAHDFDVYGGISVGDAGNGLFVMADMRAVSEEIGSGTLRGTLIPGGESNLSCVLDEVQLHPLWARYRVVDSYEGMLRGNVRISGDLNRLQLDLTCELKGYRYYHTTAMGLNPENAFDLPEAEVIGRVVLIDGVDWEFQDLKLAAPEGSLATGKNMNARGGGALVLNGRLPVLRGELDLTVSSGTISRDVTWSVTTTEKLSDVQPNLILLAEQFPQIEVKWTVDVQNMKVDCAPLTGTLVGKLTGTFSKSEGDRQAVLRASGELEMTDGKVLCLGLDGELAGRVIFNPNAPTNHATLRGTITGALGETPVNCEVTGDLQRPGFIFSGANMAPEQLGRKLYRYSPVDLGPAEQLVRREECTRIFGWDAANKENPFLARNSGKVFFSVK